MFESSYGIKVGSLSVRVGVRYAKVLTPGADVKEAFIIEPETLNWMDGLVAVGISLSIITSFGTTGYVTIEQKTP